MTDIQINCERFYERLENIQTHWLQHKSGVWGGSDAICIPFGTSDDSGYAYSKSAAFHLYLFGYEDFTDSVIVISKNEFYFMSNSKKCNFIKGQFEGSKNDKVTLKFLEKTKDEGQNREYFNQLMNVVRKGNGKRLGSLFKDRHNGAFIESWVSFVDQSQIEKVEIAPALSAIFANKDKSEQDASRNAAILTNKIIKHGFVAAMEDILDKDKKKTHSELAKDIEDIILNPAKIKVNLSANSVESCYFPIVQSNGEYDIKLSAESNNNNLAGNVILCSLGTRYKSYCATMSRTFLIDPPSKVEKIYNTLYKMYHVCLEKMIVGNELKEVYEAARDFLKKKDESLLAYLPKNVGFGMGIEFRDGNMVLNQNNPAKFTEGMVFHLSVGLHNIPLSEEDKKSTKGDYSKVNVFSLLLGDMVMVQREGVPEILTKFPKEFSEVHYDMAGGESEEDGSEEGSEAGADEEVENTGGGRKTRHARSEQEASVELGRVQQQKALMQKRLEEGRRRQKNGGHHHSNEDDEEFVEAKDLSVYKRPEELPRDLVPNRLKVDMEHEALIVPLNGRHIPFHISTIKNVTAPDPDMRINFYTSGGALGKDVAKNMKALVEKYGDTCTFIKELTFRSTDGKNLNTVYQQFQELRRRIRQREQKAEQEKGLVAQETLIKIKDQRVPRMNDITMKPQISGRKCVGLLEAHQNGLRFTSNKGEVLDVMYNNIKHTIFQPCDRTTMVLIHFHLKDFILIGKKKHKDVQFMTEVVEASLNLEGTRQSLYDVDEIEEEQREREMKKKLNNAFKEFASKLNDIATHFKYEIKLDAPSKKTGGFEGNWSKEMVTFLPTSKCLVSLTEWPTFLVTLSEVEHVHFERVTYATRNFDLVFIFKNWDIPPRIIQAIDIKYIDLIQDWLNIMEITLTKGPRSINWTDVMKLVKEEKDIFYDEVDEDGTKRHPGWTFLSGENNESDDEEEDEEDSQYSSAEESEEESGSDDDDDESDFTEEDSSSGYEDEELSEEGEDWDALEEKARKEDKLKRGLDESKNEPPAKKGRR